jgi:hypothetical protein
MLAAVEAGRVTERRMIAGPQAPDFYRYGFYVDGTPATEGQRAALVHLASRGDVRTGAYTGLIGPTEVRVGLWDQV